LQYRIVVSKSYNVPPLVLYNYYSIRHSEFISESIKRLYYKEDKRTEIAVGIDYTLFEITEMEFQSL